MICTHPHQHFHLHSPVPTGISFTAQEDAIIMENIGASPQEFCSWQVLADTKLPGKSEFVLFYDMNSCVQYNLVT